MATYRVGYHFTVRDVDGSAATITVHQGAVSDATTVAVLATNSDTINATIPGITNAKVTKRTVSFDRDEAQGVGVDAEFPLVSQKATLQFGNAAGSNGRLSIPAPLESIFRAPPSDDIVDPGSAGIVALLAALTGGGGLIRDAAGNTLNLFLGGSLSSRRRTRRRSIRS